MQGENDELPVTRPLLRDDEAAFAATVIRRSDEARHAPTDLLGSSFGVPADASSTGGVGELRLGEVLGQGGMGLVRRATQAALEREVAVKTVRPDRLTPDAQSEILREALIAGSLEHPNIIPIYGLQWSASGEPLIIMKKISGTRWSMMMHNPAARPRDAPSDMSFNLEILLQVCHAVEFAHSRGIVHRDIKPDNVMVGAFGEVYLLDWGLAASLYDDGSGRIPLQESPEFVSGTPGYLAPEMVQSPGAKISPLTDVYLLGATLHKIVTGEVRHRGKFYEAMQSALASTPYLYPSSVPAELADICNRAMHIDPMLRYPSVARFREAVRSYMSRQTSLELSREANELLEQLRVAVTETVPTPSNVGELAGRCCFAFEHILRTCPESRTATQGLHEALRLGAEGALRSERSETEPAPRPSAGASVRSPARGVFAIGLGSAAIPLVSYLLAYAFELPSRGPILFFDPALAWLLLFLGVGLGSEKSRPSSERSKLLATSGLALCVLSLVRLGAYQHGFALESMRQLDFAPLLIVLTCFAIFVDHRLRVPLTVAAVGLVATLNAPTWTVPWIYALTHVAAFVLFARGASKAESDTRMALDSRPGQRGAVP